MRHGKRRTKMSMMASHRKAMLRNMVRNLFRFQRIETTLRRAKETRRIAEHLITVAKTDTVPSRRLVFRELTDRDLISKLFKEIAPLFKSKNGGYTRIIPLGFRRGDGASMAILELTERKIVEKPSKAKKAKKEELAAKEEMKPAAKAAQAEKPKEEHKKEEPKIKTIPKSKPTLAEEKKHEKGRAEEKKIGEKKKFLKNLRGLFHRKTDM